MAQSNRDLHEVVFFIPVDNFDDLELSVRDSHRVGRRDDARPVVIDVDGDDLGLAAYGNIGLAQSEQLAAIAAAPGADSRPSYR